MSTTNLLERIVENDVVMRLEKQQSICFFARDFLSAMDNRAKLEPSDLVNFLKLLDSCQIDFAAVVTGASWYGSCYVRAMRRRAKLFVSSKPEPAKTIRSAANRAKRMIDSGRFDEAALRKFLGVPKPSHD